MTRKSNVLSDRSRFLVFAVLGCSILASCTAGSRGPEGSDPALGNEDKGPTLVGLGSEERVESLMMRYKQRIALSPSSAVTGRVLSLTDEPLGGVTVRIRDRTGVTDELGRYSITDVPVGGHVVTFEHPRYVLTQRSVTVHPASNPQVDGVLLPRSKSHRLDVDRGGTIKEGALTLHFEPNDLAFRDGRPVHGEIEVVATVIDPRKPGHIFAAPARLEGIDPSGVQVGLVSFGMMEVELFQGAEIVQVRPGQTVTTSMIIDGLDPTGSSIPMWHLDTDLGLWVQERGVFARVQNDVTGALVATAELPHFSAWNIDGVADSTCTVLQVPASQPITTLRVVSTDAAGTIDNYWTINAQCNLSARGASCVANSPSGTYGAGTYFKYQAMVGQAWCDLTVSLGTSEKTTLRGSDINAWLSANGRTPGSWCGGPTPWGYLNGSYSLQPSSLPSNRVSFIVTTSSCPSLVGGRTANLGDPGFNAMALNSLSADPAISRNIDRDSALDSVDNCPARSAAQTDANQNGLGDACEPWCSVSPDDPNAPLFDWDGDGIDDLCDNRYTTFNPSQYVPSF